MPPNTARFNILIIIIIIIIIIITTFSGYYDYKNIYLYLFTDILLTSIISYFYCYKYRDYFRAFVTSKFELIDVISLSMPV